MQRLEKLNLTRLYCRKIIYFESFCIVTKLNKIRFGRKNSHLWQMRRRSCANNYYATAVQSARQFLTKCCILGSFVIAFSMDVLKSPFSRLRASFLQLISDDVSDSSSTCISKSTSAQRVCNMPLARASGSRLNRSRHSRLIGRRNAAWQ